MISGVEVDLCTACYIFLCQGHEQGIHPGCALNWDFSHSMESTLHYKFLVRNGIRKMYIEHSIYLKMDFFKKMSGS